MRSMTGAGGVFLSCVLTLIFGWFAFFALKTGKTAVHALTLTRKENPILYWVFTVGFIFFTILAASNGVSLLLGV